MTCGTCRHWQRLQTTEVNAGICGRRESCYGYSAPSCREYVERVEPRQPVYEHLEPER